MIETDFLNQLDRFQLIIKKRVTSNYVGPRKSVAAGRGLMFKEHRQYSPGDDIRLIDWKVFARSDHLHVKTFEEERNLTVHALMDASASMGFGKPISKFEYAAMISLGFAYLAIKENEKVQFSTFNENVEMFQSRRGMSQLMNMLQHLNEVKTQGRSKFLESITQYRKIIGSKAMLILTSDLLMPIDEITEALYCLGDHEVRIVQVLDPVEKELKFAGDFKLVDSETKDKLRTYISPQLRVQYQRQLDKHCARIEETCNKLGYKYYLITTDSNIFDTFYKILD